MDIFALENLTPDEVLKDAQSSMVTRHRCERCDGNIIAERDRFGARYLCLRCARQGYPSVTDMFLVRRLLSFKPKMNPWKRDIDSWSNPRKYD